MMKKVKNISVLLFAGGQYRPDTFTPSHAGIAASSLRYPPINHYRSNLPFSSIVSRFESWLGQKAKIIFRSHTPEPPGQFFSQRMFGRSSHSAQKALFDLSQRTKKTFG